MSVGVKITLSVLVLAGIIFAFTRPSSRFDPDVKRIELEPQMPVTPVESELKSEPEVTPERDLEVVEVAEKPRGPSVDELLLFFPTKYPHGNWTPEGLTFEDAWFSAADGTRVHGWFCPCDQPRAVLLYAHGNAGNLSHRSWRMEYFQKQLRVAALIFDYRGYGRSEGRATVEGALQDARAARTFLARRTGVPESHIVLLGDSLGGAVAVDLASDGARGLILENTFSSLKEVAAYHYPRLAWLVPPEKLNSVSKLARYQGPLLQSHGDADGTIPYSLGVKLYEAAPGPKLFVLNPGGDHNDPPTVEYLRQLGRFIETLPKQ